VWEETSSRRIESLKYIGRKSAGYRGKGEGRKNKKNEERNTAIGVRARKEGMKVSWISKM